MRQGAVIRRVNLQSRLEHAFRVGILLFTGISDTQVDEQQRIGGRRLLRLLQLIDGFVIVAGADFDSGVQEVRGGIVLVQLLQPGRIFQGGVIVARIAIDLGQSLQHQGIVRLNPVGLLQFILGARHVLALAQHLTRM